MKVLKRVELALGLMPLFVQVGIALVGQLVMSSRGKNRDRCALLNDCNGALIGALASLPLSAMT